MPELWANIHGIVCKGVKAIIAVLFLLGLGGLWVGHISSHEAAHQQIYRQFGCSSEVTWFQPNAVAETVPDANCAGSAMISALHSENEIVNYNMNTMFGVQLVQAFLLLLVVIK